MEKIEEWDENVNIDWWKESRIKLNKVIRKYNNPKRTQFKKHSS